VDGLDGIRPGDAAVVLTWLHRAQRDVLRVHPRGDERDRNRACSAPAHLTAPIPLGCTPWRSCRWAAAGSECATLRR
jgi:tRNA (Thr-GGU) A37 N-methylase